MADHVGMRRPLPRMLRRALPIGIAAGVVVGALMASVVGDDIRSAWRGGQVARGGAPVPYEYGASAPQVDEMADAYGFSSAHQTGARTDADCGRMQPQFRRGCRDYLRSVADRPAAVEHGDPVATWASDPPPR